MRVLVPDRSLGGDHSKVASLGFAVTSLKVIHRGELGRKAEPPEGRLKFCGGGSGWQGFVVWVFLVVLRTDAERAGDWSAEEVVLRWRSIFPEMKDESGAPVLPEGEELARQGQTNIGRQ